MASLRIELNRLRFRLNAIELEQLMEYKKLIVQNPIGGFGFFMGDEMRMELADDGQYRLFVTSANIADLQQKRPSKDGLVFRQDDMQIHFELDIKKQRQTQREGVND